MKSELTYNVQTIFIEFISIFINRIMNIIMTEVYDIQRSGSSSVYHQLAILTNCRMFFQEFQLLLCYFILQPFNAGTAQDPLYRSVMMTFIRSTPWKTLSGRIQPDPPKDQVSGSIQHQDHLNFIPHGNDLSENWVIRIIRRQDRSATDLFPAELVPDRKSSIMPEVPRTYTEESGLPSTEPGLHSKDALLRTDKPILRTDEPILRTDEPIMHTDEPILRTDEPILHTDEPILRTDEPILHTDEPMMHTDEPMLQSNESGLHANNSVLPANGSVTHADGFMIQTDDSDLRTGESMSRTIESMLHTVESILHKDESKLFTNESKLYTDESMSRTDESILDTDESILRTDKFGILTGEPVMHTDGSLSYPDRSRMFTDEPRIQISGTPLGTDQSWMHSGASKIDLGRPRMLTREYPTQPAMHTVGLTMPTDESEVGLTMPTDESEVGLTMPTDESQIGVTMPTDEPQLRGTEPQTDGASIHIPSLDRLEFLGKMQSEHYWEIPSPGVDGDRTGDTLDRVHGVPIRVDPEDFGEADVNSKLVVLGACSFILALALTVVGVVLVFLRCTNKTSPSGTHAGDDDCLQTVDVAPDSVRHHRAQQPKPRPHSLQQLPPGIPLNLPLKFQSNLSFQRPGIPAPGDRGALPTSPSHDWISVEAADDRDLLTSQDSNDHRKCERLKYGFRRLYFTL